MSLVQRYAAPAAARGVIARAPRAPRAPAAGAPASRRLAPVAQAAAAAEGAVKKPPNPITLTPAALEHLQKLRRESGGDGLLLRMGVKSGGCSGMSYVMDFEKQENVKKDDLVMSFECEGGEFRLVCDPKSLLYLFGMQLDWSSALVGGGFQFNNPNAESSCGCGKSFGV
ncbi:Iron-sulfur cluster assembly accessory [Chlorella sorokiniana]|jgi:iron-sulfur cluster assembly protein|uniref:Iron-sulfur cluster assembly accessory n=1 Tax=Chlorella sorokiniana TaxID=3076 RepID=A0A2P6TZ36_CHLSO|nr:Iron-sulfur cluster assembly accessory [Chlorella sorokiniana]|eukprot:PRW59324.1 Iron-sulfur cluster assembly accessory [Chlorella sorokiniana]